MAPESPLFISPNLTRYELKFSWVGYRDFHWRVSIGRHNYPSSRKPHYSLLWQRHKILICIWWHNIQYWNYYDVREFRCQLTSLQKSTLVASQSREMFLQYHSLSTHQPELTFREMTNLPSNFTIIVWIKHSIWLSMDSFMAGRGANSVVSSCMLARLRQQKFTYLT